MSFAGATGKLAHRVGCSWKDHSLSDRSCCWGGRCGRWICEAVSPIFRRLVVMVRNQRAPAPACWWCSYSILIIVQHSPLPFCPRCFHSFFGTSKPPKLQNCLSREARSCPNFFGCDSVTLINHTTQGGGGSFPNRTATGEEGWLRCKDDSLFGCPCDCLSIIIYLSIYRPIIWSIHPWICLICLTV